MECISADALFKAKKRLIDEAETKNRMMVCERLKDQFIEHLFSVAENPLEAGSFHFDIKSNDIDAEVMLSNGFLHTNTEYFNNYLNEYFSHLKYEITLEYLYCSDAKFMAYYAPIGNKLKKFSWKSLFKKRIL